MKLSVTARKVLFGFLLFGGAAAALVCLFHKPATPLSVEAQKVKALYEKIEIDMLEQEVDKICAGYRVSSWDQRRDHDARGDPLPRPAYRTKTYSSGQGNEFDFFVVVFLDDAGRVVGKSWGEWDK